MLTAPVAEQCCVIYNSAINLAALLVTFMSFSPVRDTLPAEKKASQLSHYHHTPSDLYSTGRTSTQKLYILISRNAYSHSFYTEEFAGKLNHPQFRKLTLWHTELI